MAGFEEHNRSEELDCAIASAPHGSISRIFWRKFTVRKGRKQGIDLVARLFQKIHTRVLAAHCLCDGASAPIRVLQLLTLSPLCFLDTQKNDAALWLINADGTLCEDWDADLAELEVCETGEYVLKHAPETDIPAHTRLLRAMELEVAEMFSQSTKASVRCSKGVFLMAEACTVQFHSHTTHSQLFIQMSKESMPWRLLDLDYKYDSLATITAGESQILLLPSLVEATFIGTDPCTSTAASLKLAQALHLTSSRINFKPNLYCRVCVMMESPPSAASSDVLNMGLNAGNSSVPITLCWPLELCLQRIRADDQNNLHLTPLRQRSVRSLIEAYQKESSSASIRRSEAPKDNGLVPTLSVSIKKGAMDDDIYSGIGQLTEDDLRFFDEPGPFSTDYDDLRRKDSGEPNFGPDQCSDPALDSIYPVITPLKLPSLSLPIADAHDSLSTPLLVSPGSSSRISDKYDPQGKFYTPASSGSRKRAHSFDLIEGRKSTRISQQPTESQDSEVSPSNISGSSSPSSSSPDNNENRLVLLALQIRRLHLSEWIPPTYEAFDGFCQPNRSAFSLALATLGYVKAQKPILEPCKWDALCTEHIGVYLDPPRVLVGDQRAIIETDLDALRVWPILGLEPIDGPKRISVAVVLVGEFDLYAVRQWLEAVEQYFATLRLGTIVWSDLLFWRYNKLEQEEGGFISLSDAFSMAKNLDSCAILLMFAPDTRHEAEQAFERWHKMYAILPVPRSNIISCTTLNAYDLANHAHRLYTTARRTDMSTRPSAAISPTHYEQCQILRPKSGLGLVRKEARYDVLRHGSVLHIAYDLQQGTEGVRFRVVGIDDRAQRTFFYTWTSSTIMEGIEQIWTTTLTEICSVLCVKWHVVICRAGSPLADEIGEWSVLEQRNLVRGNQNILDVILACADVQMILVDLPKDHQRQLAIFLPESTAPIQGSSFPALGSSYVANPHLGTGWSVHLLQVFCDGILESVHKKAYLKDVVIHLAALEHLESLRRTPHLAALPWHLAVLLYHVDQ